MTQEILDLQKILGEPIPVRLPSGREVRVLPFDGSTRLELRRLKALPAEQQTGDEAWALVAKLIPEATAEEVAALSPAQVAAVFRVASAGIEAVQELLAEGKGTDPGAARGPASGTATPTPSSASPAAADAPSATSSPSPGA